MPSPRVFVSSTCYDLKDIRFQLRNFVEEFGFEPVMSDYGDIFYNYEEHIQDACLQEIKRCQLFILIIGDNYDSLYHEEDKNQTSLDSVTLKEFKRALENDVYKHIFINKFVDHDYKNYKRALDKAYLKYFQEHDVPDKEIRKSRKKIKKEFDESYSFPDKSYRYIFYFMDLIYSLEKNNAVFPFESFDEIKSSLRKQWAGFMYDSIIKENSVPIDLVHKLSDKIGNLESRINKLLDTKSVNKNSKISFDVKEIVKDLNIENLEEIQEKANNALNQILRYQDRNPRIEFTEGFNESKVQDWIERLEDIVKSYKWSKYVELENLFSGIVSYKYWESRTSIPYEAILELYTIIKSFNNEDLNAFINTLKQEFNNYYKVPEDEDQFDEIDDDLPF